MLAVRASGRGFRLLISAGLVLLSIALVACGSAPSGEWTPGILAQTLAGTDDVELTYDVDGTADSLSNDFGADLRALILQRLGAAQIGADVTQAAKDRRVKIVVDEAMAARVDELVTWTGTLVFFEPDQDTPLPPRDASSHLTAVETPPDRTGGRADRWFEGSRDDVIRAIETWSVDRDHRVLAEPIRAAGDHHRTPTRWRTRLVRATPVSEIGDGALVGWGDGPTLRIRGAARSPASMAIDLAARRPIAPVVARGRISLGVPRFDEGVIVLAFGEGAAGYARAQRERRLLMTPRLVPLRRVDAIGLPPNRTLALACLILPVLLSLGWLAFVRRFDRAHPEPIWLIAVTFMLGVLSTQPAGLLEHLLASASPWLDPNLVTFGGKTFALPLTFVVFTVVVGLSEEGAKRLAAQYAVRRKEFDEPVDGIVYGIVASLGFAAAENIRYFAIGRLSAPLVIARCFMSVPAHMFFGALWGYALGERLVDPKKRVWGYLLLAAACHGLFDALLSIDGAAILAVVLNVALASVFVLVVQRTLRHGVVSKEMLGIRPEDRLLVRVGRPRLFWASSALVHLLAFGIFLLGAYYQLARYRPSVAFVVSSSVMVALLGVAAFGVSQTVPLDVAIDAYGVTFAGAARPWRHIRGYTVHPDRVELDCEAGPILLGPAPPPIIQTIAAALEARVGKDRLLTLESRS